MNTLYFVINAVSSRLGDQPGKPPASLQTPQSAGAAESAHDTRHPIHAASLSPFPPAVVQSAPTIAPSPSCLPRETMMSRTEYRQWLQPFSSPAPAVALNWLGALPAAAGCRGVVMELKLTEETTRYTQS